ncbi:alpha/beta fold hydrolase [Phaeobacter gallaeciensis]|uniref:alpha/beta fold hydrolase n=1 Tax=Phaeobacter gallaeciensis TaxID=60890 RepID=UPI00237F88E9|nr:alpha/beta hydrolase [Phaeobacter gallaeciensis]MDE4097096.1 alpha/beta hydrolase [Phaeobacter gallaeciensis]MDE4105611.1 alpha/beta hydrolase [Phaeobacter gallaeciensis]MDE4110363.1 alpha/beta hydrolase [Phaeobacter gallaeciensis]MDE4114831.1 alpha/beta hydrolase [Phaeobacter gallaeciensis]MDE4119002.1 alpha/beta hydrolase [Phaeobacter gallaeciensis]
MTFDPMNMLNSALVTAALTLSPAVAPSSQASTMPETAFSSQMIEGLTIAYREAGDPRNPTVLLLHGFPSSSYMFRDLIPVLAEKYHVIAPDYPGFGASDMPLAADYDYSFANTADLVTQLLDQKGVKNYAVYMTDYGAPVGFRMFAEDPARVSGFIIQNANAYEEGLREFWGPMRAYWADPSPENGDALRGFLTLDATKWQFTHGAENPASVSPDHFWHAQYLLDRPGNQEVQLEMFLDYGSNLSEYPKWQALFREHQPPALLVWGANDQICPEEGAHPYKRDLTDLEFHLLNTGHFALQEKGPEIAGKMLSFLDRINN